MGARLGLAFGILVLGAVALAPPVRVGAAPRRVRMADVLSTIFAGYRGWGRVDDEVRWAPFLCRLPLPSQARVSRAGSESEHTQKLYFVYAKDRAAYVGLHARPRSPVGQVVVKEAFHPRALGAGTDPNSPAGADPAGAESPGGPLAYRPATRDEQRFGPGAFAGLYVMAKTNARRSDRGWEYATLDATGAVTASGRMASCMSCHRDAPHDRLFGL